jgi:hypothetical protein
MSSVTPAEDLSVIVTWLAGTRAGRTEEVDLAPLINSLKYYRPLRNDRPFFESVHLSERGRSLLWGEGDDELDMAATSVERLAEETMTADDFRKFIDRLDYTHNTAGAQLGYSRRQIENFLSGTQSIPRVCALACIALEYRHSQHHAHTRLLSTAHTTHTSTWWLTGFANTQISSKRRYVFASQFAYHHSEPLRPAYADAHSGASVGTQLVIVASQQPRARYDAQ